MRYLLIVLLLLPSVCFSQILSDAKGDFILSKTGSKMRFLSPKDKENYLKGKVYGTSTDYVDMSGADKAQMVADQEAQVIQEEEMDAEQLIGEKKRAIAIEELIKANKIEKKANGKYKVKN